MALIVEDGTGKPDAESYASVAFADAYFKSLGEYAWLEFGTSQKEQFLRKATIYIEGRFASRFKGFAQFPDVQILSFPRDNKSIVPVCLQRATAEYAVRASVAPLVADPVTDERGLQIKSKSEGLGPLSEKIEYVANGVSVFKPYPAADMLLKSLLRPAGLIR